MVTCRCDVLNVLSGDAARDYLAAHLIRLGTDGMGQTVHRCSVTSIEWIEERTPGGYADDVTVLRRRHD
jgi:hypothetical protein